MPPRFSRRQNQGRRNSGPPDVTKALKQAKDELETEQQKAKERAQQKNNENPKGGAAELPTSEKRSPKVSFDSNATSGSGGGSGSGPRNKSIGPRKQQTETRSNARSPKTSFDNKAGGGGKKENDTRSNARSPKASLEDKAGGGGKKDNDTRSNARSPKTSFDTKAGGKKDNGTRSNARSPKSSFDDKASVGAQSRKSKSKKRSTDTDANAALEEAMLKGILTHRKRPLKGSLDNQSIKTGRSILKRGNKRRGARRRTNKSGKRRKRKTRFHQGVPVTPRTVTPTPTTLWTALASIHDLILQRTQSKVKYRGRYATAIKMPLVFRVLTDVRFGVCMEALTCIILFVYYVLATFQFFFGFQSTGRNRFFLMADFIFITELTVRLIFEIFRHRMDLDFEFFFLPTTPKFWIVGLLAVAPLEYCRRLFGFETLSDMRTTDLLRFSRLMVFLRIQYLFDYLDREHYISEMGAFLCKFFSFYAGLAHLIACLMFYQLGVTSIDQLLHRGLEKTYGTWFHFCVDSKPAYEPRPTGNYLLTATFVNTALTTVGFGDCGAQNEIEMILIIGMTLLVPVYLVGYFMSAVTGFNLVRDGAKQDLFLRHELIQRYLNEARAPALLKHKIREYYSDYFWNYRQGVHKVRLIRHLPPCMYEDVLYDICLEMFGKSPLLRGLEKPFLRALSKKADVLLYNPDMVVCQRGQSPRAMYYIIHGECRVGSVESDKDKDLSTVLRAGCIFGESSLLLPVPYMVNVNTKTCCQLLVIKREKFLSVCLEFPHSLFVMRLRLKSRLANLKHEYELLGSSQVVWVKRKETPENDDDETDVPKPEESGLKIIIRWAEGLNTIVPEKDLDDPAIEDTVIVEMMSAKDRSRYEHISTYGRCIVPVTLAHPHALLQAWHLFVAVLCPISFLSFALRTIMQAAPAHGPQFLEICTALDFLAEFVFFVDVILEIFTATPTTGWTNKFRDGLRVKSRQASFYLDIFSVLPHHQYVVQRIPSEAVSRIFGYLGGVLGRYLKGLLKVSRYCEYLGEKYPERLFLFRLIRALLYFVMTVAAVAAVMFRRSCQFNAVGTNECLLISWLGTPYIQELMLYNYSHLHDVHYQIANGYPVLVSAFFSTALVTTTGYGDFSSQNFLEAVILYVIQYWSFTTAYFTATMTSALIAMYLAQVRLEGKLITIKNFFETFGISTRLRERIIEHYKLQHQFNGGVVLPEGVVFLLYDAPVHLYEDMLFQMVDLRFEGIPIFTHADPSVIIAAAKEMKRYILPPNITFIRRGEVRRQMYVVIKGSMAILKEDTDEVKAILTDTGHFGLRDLLFGEPAFNNIKTLSYCVLGVIEYATFAAVFADDVDLMATVESQKLSLKDRIRALDYVFCKVGAVWEKKERKPTQIPAWITFPTKKKPFTDFCDYEEFQEGYNVPGGWLWRRLLMRRTIHPAGTFALFWCLFTAAVSIISALIVCMRLLGHYLTLRFSLGVTIMKFIYAVDVYLRLHWAFYTESNHLVCHPVFTAKHYLLDGSLFYSLVPEIVLNWMYQWVFNPPESYFSHPGIYWNLKLGATPAFPFIFRLSAVLQYGHQISVHRTLKLCLIYGIACTVVCLFFASIAVLIACPWPENISWMAGDLQKLPACYESTWISTSPYLRNATSYGPQRLTVAVYYIHQALFNLGYGDMVTPHIEEMYLLIFVMIFGYISIRCIISDMTATTASGDESRNEFLEQIKTITAVMRTREVDRDLILSVTKYLKNIWLISRGFHAHDLFGDLHPGLEADLFREYIGAFMSRVPIFSGVSESVMRKICVELKRCYFFRGDPIARRGNLELEMYIIVDGDVWITSENVGFKCTLGPGETFGEADMMYGLTRRYAAVAADYVEVLALSAESFAQILEHYPGLKERMEKILHGHKEDVFERKIYLLDKIRQRLAPDDGKVFRDGVERVALTIQRSINYDRSFRYIRGSKGDAKADIENGSNRAFVKFLKCRVLYWGPDNDNLPFLYFATSHGKRRPKLLVHPRCGFHKLFYIIILMICVLSPAAATYFIVFIHDEDDTDFDLWAQRNSIFDIVYSLHILLQFITPFRTFRGRFCKDHGKIFCRYVGAPTRFWLDLLTTFPFQFVVNTYGHGSLRYLNLLPSLRLMHYYRSIREDYEMIEVTTFRNNLAHSLPAIGLLAHMLACVFYAVSACHTHEGSTSTHVHKCREGTWTFNFMVDFVRHGSHPEEEDPGWKWYIRSLYWMLTTASTIGFGDIVPVNLVEVILSLICTFCGTFLLAIVLCQLSAGVTSLQKSRLEYLYRLKGDVRHLLGLGLSPSLKSTLIEWFLLRWDYSRGRSVTDALSILPLSMREYICLELYHSALARVPLFSGLDKRFFTSLASAVNHTFFLPGQVIANEGDKGGTLFVVISGRVAGYCITTNGKAKLMRWYLDYSMFGRLPALFYNAVYTKTYRAEVLTEVLTLSSRSIFYLARYFPEFLERLQLFIARKYDARLGVETILSPLEMETRESKIATNAREMAAKMKKSKKRVKRKPQKQKKQADNASGRFKSKRRAKASKFVLSYTKQVVEDNKQEQKAKTFLQAFDIVKKNQQKLQDMELDKKAKKLLGEE